MRLIVVMNKIIPETFEVEAESKEAAVSSFYAHGGKFLDVLDSLADGEAKAFEPGEPGEAPYPVTPEERRLREENKRFRALMGSLLEWESIVGGWDSPCWRDAREFFHALPAEGG